MANNYNSNPIYIDTTFTSWRANQTLNVGNQPSILQQSAPVSSQWGIKVIELSWVNPGAGASFVVVDPKGGNILWKGTTSAAFAGADPYWYFGNDPLPWRDFSITISAGTLLIKYRS